MYDCPACGGNLKFDIKSQQLACAFCNASYDPYQITKDKDGEEQNDFEVTIFTCPQCGGEILSTDNTAAGFCSFCGASTVLTSRLSREKKPNFIIPFQKTKEDCKKEYEKMMRRFIYAPSEISSPDKINEFRGIYMPYWVYFLTQKGHIVLKGTKSHRRGDYVITRYYDLSGNLDAYYKGISYDGSSSFSDRISESIAPFDVKHMKEFTPSILSGFYADTTDLGDALYASDARDFANDETKKYVMKNKEFSGYSVSGLGDENRAFNTKINSADLAMFPVWFMSYNNGERVSYATINGQTGKIFADLPVSVPKYILGAGVLAVPIFFLLNAFLTIIPTTLVSVVAVIAMVAAIIYCVELNKIAVKENDEDDKGKIEGERLARIRREKREREAAKAAGIEMPVDSADINKKDSKKAAKKKIPMNRTLKTFLIILAVFFFSGPAAILISTFVLALGKVGMCALSLVTAVITYVVAVSKVKKIDAKKGLPVNLSIVIADALALIVGVLAPAKDIYYYAMVIIMLVAVGMTLVDLIKCYNIFATRKLPQFDYHGGDDDA